MIDFDNPLDQESLDDAYKATREVLGDDITRSRQFIIGRLNVDGSVSTTVNQGEYGRIWVRQPGEDTGDAVQAINTILQPHEITFNNPVMMIGSGSTLEVDKRAPQSADYNAQLPTAPQKPINRSQYRLALIHPTQPESSFYVNYTAGVFQLNNTAYQVTDRNSTDFAGTVPGSGTLSIKVEVDPLTQTWYETTGTNFTQPSLRAAFKNGDLNTTRADGRFLLGWVRLYEGQETIEVEDILPGEHMLDLIDDVNVMVHIEDYVYKLPASDSRNTIQPTGDFNSISANDSDGTLQWYFEENGDFITQASDPSNVIVGSGAGRLSASENVHIGNEAGKVSTADDNTFVGWWAGVVNTTGEYNVAIGPFAMGQNLTGSECVAVGDAALWRQSSGNYNVGLGAGAGGNVTGGNYSVFLGPNAGPSTIAAYSNTFWLNNAASDTPLVYGDFATPELNIHGSFVSNPGAVATYDHRWASVNENYMLYGDANGNTDGQLFLGGTLNAIQIDKGGELRLIGDATCWDDIRVAATGASRLGFSDPDWVKFADDGAGSVGVYAPAFDNVKDEELFFSVQMPHNWNLGTDLDAHIHWSPSNTDTGSVTWKLEYTIAEIGGTFGNTVTLAVTDPGDGVDRKHQYADLGDIDMSSYTANTDVSIMLMCRVYRDVSDADDYNADAFLLEVDFHYQIDSFGSRTEISK